MKKPKKTPLDAVIPEHLQAAVSKLVRYYYEGWRAGYLDGFTKMGAAIIRPISAIGGKEPHTIKVEQENVELIGAECTHASKEVYGDCACNKEIEWEPQIHEEPTGEVHTVTVVIKPEVESDVKKTKRGCRL